jgi:hypothetical protein
MKDRQRRDTRAVTAAWGLGAAVLVFALLLVLAGGPGGPGTTAAAQGASPTPVYQIPTPTPTPTPQPFTNSGATPTPTPTPTASRPSLLRPFPVVHTAGSFAGAKTHFSRVTVKAPTGSKLAVSCTKHRCKKLTQRFSKTRTVRLKTLQKTYKAGTTLTFRISSPIAIGKYVAIRTRTGKPPVRHDSCLVPGRSRPTPCGTG